MNFKGCGPVWMALCILTNESDHHGRLIRVAAGEDSISM